MKIADIKLEKNVGYCNGSQKKGVNNHNVHGSHKEKCINIKISCIRHLISPFLTLLTC